MSATTAGHAPLPGTRGHLAYELTAPGDGAAPRAIVLIHAHGLDRRMWDAEVSLLARDHAVVRFDARGHGESSTPDGDWGHHDDVVALLDYLEITRATLVGAGLGAATALDVALTVPERVESMLLVSPLFTGMTLRDPWILEQAEIQAQALSRWNPLEWTEAFLRAWVDGPRREGKAAPEVRARCRDMAYMTLVRHAPTASGSPAAVGAEHRLTEISCPVVVAHGQYDATDVDDVVEQVAGSLPGTPADPVCGAGHMLNLDQPARFAQILTGFLAGTA